MHERVQTLRDVRAVIREPLRLGFRCVRGEAIEATVGRYHLRGSGLVVHLRHDVLDDVATLLQTFRHGRYVLPPGAAGELKDLGRPIHAMDLGANIGMFGAWFLSQQPNARVTAYEADPANAHVHSLTVEANRKRVRWEVVPAAAGVADGEVSFLTGRATHSRLASDGDADATVVPVHDVLARARDVELLKVDIEGAEWSLLGDPRFAEIPARVVALEYHVERCPSDDPCGAALSALTQAGYDVALTDLGADPGHGMVWGWRSTD